MTRINPKVLVPFILGHIATLITAMLALFNVIPVDPKVVVFLGEALTFLQGIAGYQTTAPGLPTDRLTAVLDQVVHVLGQATPIAGTVLQTAAPVAPPVTVNVHPPAVAPAAAAAVEVAQPAAAAVEQVVPEVAKVATEAVGGTLAAVGSVLGQVAP